MSLIIYVSPSSLCVNYSRGTRTGVYRKNDVVSRLFILLSTVQTFRPHTFSFSNVRQPLVLTPGTHILRPSRSPSNNTTVPLTTFTLSAVHSRTNIKPSGLSTLFWRTAICTPNIQSFCKQRHIYIYPSVNFLLFHQYILLYMLLCEPTLTQRCARIQFSLFILLYLHECIFFRCYDDWSFTTCSLNN